MIITGIDLSHRHTGVATVEYKEDPKPSIQVWGHRVINFKPKGKSFVDLVVEIHDLRYLLKTLKSECETADEIYIEIPLLGGKPNASSYRSFGVCHAIGAALIEKYDTKIQLISPYHLKEWSGSKKNKKEHVDAKVRERYGSLITTKNDNIIDALAICTIRTDELTKRFYANQRQGSTDSFRLSTE